MPSFEGSSGRVYAYSADLTGGVAVIEPDGQGGSRVVAQLELADIMGFSQHLCEQARYDEILRLRVKAGDVLLVRCPKMGGLAATDLENQVRNSILKPLGLADSVVVCALDGAVDLEVVGKG